MIAMENIYVITIQCLRDILKHDMSFFRYHETRFCRNAKRIKGKQLLEHASVFITLHYILFHIINEIILKE